MKSLYLIIFSFSIAITGFAQPKKETGPNTVQGTIIDNLSGKPAPYATIAIYKAQDSSLLNGGITDERGQFRVEQLPNGTLYLQVSAIGYDKFRTEPFALGFKDQLKDFGVLKINPVATVTKEVEVKAERAAYTNSIDKKVYDVSKNLTNVGGTATDILQNVPSVTVDMDGKVSLRGSENVTVLIDGKPSTLTGSDRQAVLQQLPASMIESVEIITNPSARFDAEGMAGIINIVTKKGKGQGFNGTVMAAVSTHDKYNTSVSLNKRTAKFNLYGDYSFRHESRFSFGEGSQYTHYPTDTYYYNNSTHGISVSDFHSGKLGFDWYIDNYNTLGINVSASSRSQDQPETLTYEFQDAAHTPYKTFYHDNNTVEKNHNLDASLDYKRSFHTVGKQLTANVSFSGNKRTSDNSYSDIVSEGFGKPYQTNNTITNAATVLSQIDYTLPIKESGKLDAGLKNTWRRNDNSQDFSALNYNTLLFSKVAKFSDHFLYNEDISAAYLMYSGKMNKKWEYNAGLRAENTLSNGVSAQAGKSFVNNYFAFFPSGAIKYTQKPGRELQLGYSRRLNRPMSFFMNPFIDYSDSLNVRMGNPALKPEFIHSFDLSYSFFIKDLSVLSSVYYRHSTGIISFRRNFDINTGVALTTFSNFSTSENIGSDLTLRYPLGKAGNIMASGSIFQNKINGSNVENGLQSTAFSWNSRISANYRFKTGTSIQASGMYNGPMIRPEITFLMGNGFDFGMKQELFKGKLAMGLNLTDIFNMRRMRITNTTQYYYFEGMRGKESRILTFSLTWRLGKLDPNAKRKPVKQDQPQMDDQGVGF